MIEVLKGGLYTTVQDYPGRIGYWNVGVPPSGPMDVFAFRIANRLVGNSDRAAGLEITAIGPKLVFKTDALIALTGARLKGTINNDQAPWWEAIFVKKGSVLSLKGIRGLGLRSYLAVAGGLDVPEYLGSKSTFPKGMLGGYEGRPLKKGDVLRLNRETPDLDRARRLAFENIPQYKTEWEVGVLPGPHSAPDFFTPATVETFYCTPWLVHHDSNRFGYRLVGPKPEFARKDGGEGGTHPSNVNDYAYAIGAVNFTGDMPIILMVDGPSLGGFVSLATVVTSELWKVGQAKPHDRIRFKKITLEEALANSVRQENLLELISATS